MDQSRFDALTRRLAAGTSRRAGLKAALGGLLGVGMASLAPAGESAAKKKRKKKRGACLQPNLPCSSTSECCGSCVAGQCCAAFDQQCSVTSDCCPNLACLGGYCVASFY